MDDRRRRVKPLGGCEEPPLFPKDGLISGTDMLLQSSSVTMTECQPSHETTSRTNHHSSSSGIKTTEVTEGSPDCPVSGIDLLIQASEVSESRPIKHQNGISLILEAAELLETESVNSLISRLQMPPLPSSSVTQTDASSSASVDLYIGEPVDVAISWVEKHLANIERDTQTAWLRDHTYIRPRPINPKGHTLTCLSPKIQDMCGNVATGIIVGPDDGVINNENDADVQYSETEQTSTRAFSKAADVSQRAAVCLRPSFSHPPTSRSYKSALGTSEVWVQSPSSDRQTTRPVQAVRPVKRVNQTPIVSTTPDKRPCLGSSWSDRPVTRSYRRYQTRYGHQQQLRNGGQLGKRIYDSTKQRSYPQRTRDGRPVAVVRPMVRSKSNK